MTSNQKRPNHVSIPRVLARGMAHMLCGLVVALSALFLPRNVFLISLTTITACFVTLELLRIRHRFINRLFWIFLSPFLRKKEVSRLTGASFLLIAALLSFLLFSRNVAIMAVCFTAVGDATASMIGRYFGRRKIFRKTLEGDLAGLSSCLVVAIIFYAAGFPLPLWATLIGAVVATLAVALPIPLNDNLAMPLLSGLAMTLILF